MNYVALLRAVNLGPHNKIGMWNLRGMLADLGFSNPRSVLQSGNLIFGAQKQTTGRLEKTLHEEVRARFALETPFFVRDAWEWSAIVDANPFPREAVSDPTRLVVIFLGSAQQPDLVDSLRAAIRGRERIHGIGRVLYAVYPDGIGRSELTLGLIERKLGVSATARNWKTVGKIARLAGE